MASGSPQWDPRGPNEVPQKDSDGAPQESPDGAPQAGPDGAPQTADGARQSTAPGEEGGERQVSLQHCVVDAFWRCFTAEQNDLALAAVHALANVVHRCVYYSLKLYIINSCKSTVGQYLLQPMV